MKLEFEALDAMSDCGVVEGLPLEGTSTFSYTIQQALAMKIGVATTAYRQVQPQHHHNNFYTMSVPGAPFDCTIARKTASTMA